MEAKTKAEYRQVARQFLARWVIGQGLALTPDTITAALLEAAHHYRPGYWVRLRRALVVALPAPWLEGISNPVPQGQRVKKKARRRGVGIEEHRALMQDARERADRQTMAALLVALALGPRPAELPGIRHQVEGDQLRVFIPSAKKDQAGQRGLDRVVVLPYRQGLASALGIVQQLDAEGVRGVQRRIDRASRRLWPSKRARPSLYSYRHQLGSDLKASGLDRRRVAAIMGHRSQQSVDTYGNRRTASSWRTVLPQPTPATVEGVSSRPPRTAPQRRRRRSRTRGHQGPGRG